MNPSFNLTIADYVMNARFETSIPGRKSHRLCDQYQLKLSMTIDECQVETTVDNVINTSLKVPQTM